MPRTIARFAAAALLVPLAFAPARAARAQAVPDRLDDRAFWGLVSGMSEPGGFFRSDNFVSNETSYQYVVPDLQRAFAPGAGAYVGVGPDQNFTYIVALRPRIAFVVDIRRQNMLQHLLYKALIETSDDRAAFLARLFSRPRPAGLAPEATVDTLLAAFARAEPDSQMFRRTLAQVTEHLVARHGFPLDTADLRGIEYVLGAFHQAGPDLTYSFGAGTAWQTPWRRRTDSVAATVVGRDTAGAVITFRPYPGFRGMPTFAQIASESDAQRTQRNYLASEANYRVLRDLQRRNLIVPLVGDFAGPKALRAVGAWLRERHTPVTAFYTSNVEQYLFRQGDDWAKFFDNAAELPTAPESVFIRAVFSFLAAARPRSPAPGPASTTVLSPLDETVRAVRERRVTTYQGVIEMSKE